MGKIKIVPAKNIDAVLVDVKKPRFDYDRFKPPPKINLSRFSKLSRPNLFRANKFWKWTALSLVFVAILSLILFWNVRGLSAELKQKGGKIVDNFSLSVKALKDLRTDDASKYLEDNHSELAKMGSFFGRNESFLGFVGEIVPIFKDASGFLNQITKLNLDLLRFSTVLSDLEANGFEYFQKNGKVLTEKLAVLRDLLKNINEGVGTVRNSAVNLKQVASVSESVNQIFADQYLKYSSELHSADKFLGSLISVLGSETDKHFALFFQNPAEIRPGGGFIGSYGDLIFKNGQMTNLEVQDIYWPDHPLNFKSKVIPPEPLQSVTKDWGARDANWFFDFPTSARTVLGFLEKSKIYEEKNIGFEGAIALNINVLQSILEIVGPIEIEEYKLKIDKDNFLKEIQYEVEAGRDKKPGQNPKKILSVLTPIILERLKELPTEGKRSLIEKLASHIKSKDIMVFAKDLDLENFFIAKNLGGAVYSLPNNFWGSYLAVVNANIAGGKSDAFIDQSVDVKIDLDTEGGIFTDLRVLRTHRGDKEKDPWWRAPNKDYIQIFTNPNSSLFSLKGNDSRVTELPTYLNYEVNSDLDLIEKTKVFMANYKAWSLDAFGKKVFSTWLVTPAGKTKELNLRYHTPGENNQSFREGKSYQFIFERQSGVKSSLKVALSAPLGYIWEDTKMPIFIYENNNPESRVILNLAIKKVEF